MANESRDILPAIEVPQEQQRVPEQQVAEQQQAGSSAAGERAASLAVERGLLAGGLTTSQGNDPAAMAMPAGAMAQVIPQDPAHASQGVAPQTADDTDLIEKEWVLRAKEIVRRTQYDPHIQNTEISKMKADYLRKRYNKELKVAED